jgi:dihydroorotase
MRFDLLIKGGTVIDRTAGAGDRMDVAIKRGRVAALEREIPAESALQLIRADNQIVTPGLIDLHTHVYTGVSFWGVSADPIAARTGVTTWVDAGSAGALTLRGLREFVAARSRVRILSYLNLSSIGLVHKEHELALLDYCDSQLCAKLARLNTDFVRGIKVRMGGTMVGPHGAKPMRLACDAAAAAGMPLMVHIGYAPPSAEEVLDLMRPGDILTHAMTGASMKIVSPEGRLIDAARRALDRGIVLDVGHGYGSFSWETAEALLSAGIRPDTISSDLHQRSVFGPVFDLPTCLSKFLHLGLSLDDVIHAATARPAELLGLQGTIGTLSPGAVADIALFELDEGGFRLFDSRLEARTARYRLRNTLTIVAGQILPTLDPEPPAPWITLTDFQRPYADRARRDLSHERGGTMESGLRTAQGSFNPDHAGAVCPHIVIEP